MSCNAHNHAADCNCGFGGQRSASVVDPVVRHVSSALARRRSPCPHCGRLVFFVRGRSGGVFYLNDLDLGWLAKHECSALRKTSKPRIAASAWRRGGWVPIAVGQVVDTPDGQIVSAAALTDDTAFQFRLLVGGTLVSGYPAFYRVIDELVGTLEIDYLDDETGELQGNRVLAEKLAT